MVSADIEGRLVRDAARLQFQELERRAEFLLLVDAAQVDGIGDMVKGKDDERPSPLCEIFS
jgi:hypothetical protein